MRLSHRHSSESVDVDTTPMLDVVFILLIFFLVTASYLEETGFDLYTPNNKVTDQSAIPAIVVFVGGDGLVSLNNRPIALAAFASRLQAEHVINKSVNVTLVSHPRAKTQSVVRVLDRIRLAGVLSTQWRLGNDPL